MQKEQMFWKWYSYLLFVWSSLAQKTILLTNTIRNVCLRAIPFQRTILYVGNNLVISLDTAAEQTRLCDGKLKGLSGPLRIPHKHRLDKPNFAQGSLHLPENWSNTFANTFKISLFSEPAKTIPPQGHIVFPWGLWEILSYCLQLYFFFFRLTITRVMEEKSQAPSGTPWHFLRGDIAKCVGCLFIYFLFCITLFMNINVASWWDLFAVLSGLEEAIKYNWENNTG